jgi:predicted nucleic acid-binding protein
MAKQVLLDAGPLGMISHPRPNEAIVAWLRTLLEAGVSVRIPEIADYEVRRELLRANRRKGVQRLDDLKAALGYVPITTAVMLKAAEYWALARNHGFPTADDLALDADVILAAQATILQNGLDEVVIVTTNVGHLGHFVDARKWDEVRQNDLL